MLHLLASCFILYHVDIYYVLRVVPVNESVVDPVTKEEHQEFEFDLCDPSLKNDFTDTQGKPRMHLNRPCVLQIYIAFAFLYCIK